MTNINEIYPSGNALKAEDLKGHTVRVTIRAHEVKTFDKGSKLVLHFEGKEKTLVCNKTNAKVIASQFGNDPDSWIGKSVELYPDKTMFAAELVDCIRVRIPSPVAKDNEISW